MLARSMVIRFALLCLMGAAAAHVHAAVAITHVRIIDGNGGAVVEHGTVLLDGTRFLAVGPASQVHIPVGAKRIDGGGKTVLPGLADMHVHLLGGTNGLGLDILGYQKYLNALLWVFRTS